MSDSISILYPEREGVVYKTLSDTTCHDLAIDFVCSKLSDKVEEQRMIQRVLATMTADPYVARFRGEVFQDILNNPELRKEMMELLDKIRFMKDYGSFKRDYDKKAGIWDLMHRLEEIHDYIRCVEGIRSCLGKEQVKSEGLRRLKEYVDAIYEEASFGEMKTDIENLKADTDSMQSITLGINLNERFEAASVGIISVNDKPFKDSGIVGHFARSLERKNAIQSGNEWDGDMHYQPIENESGILEKITFAAKMGAVTRPSLQTTMTSTISVIPEGDGSEEITHYMDKAMNQLLTVTVKKLREVLTKYVSVTITTITDLMPEFVYYIRFAEFIEGKKARGLVFSEAEVLGTDLATGAGAAEKTGDLQPLMDAKGIYNLKLAYADLAVKEIVPNDLSFDKAHMVYILTGANRGGKTTITQAIGQLYVLAQGGIHIPGEAFRFVPVDDIYTHFPADEDKTLDLGRLGEECTRFKEMYTQATKDSLLLLNETFSTTSFEEGYYIAKDAIRAILKKGVRTIYNTHMHKLAADVDEMNAEAEYGSASLIVKTEEGNRSFRVMIAPPEGMSYANDIARKYGVTYEMLSGENG